MSLKNVDELQARYNEGHADGYAAGCIDGAAKTTKALAPVHEPDDGYDLLRAVYARAVEQASAGKGKERHASAGETWTDQRIIKLGEWMKSDHFQVGQAVKKAVESLRMPRDRAVRELLGAMNYLAAAVTVLELLPDGGTTVVDGVAVRACSCGGAAPEPLILAGDLVVSCHACEAYCPAGATMCWACGIRFGAKLT